MEGCDDPCIRNLKHLNDCFVWVFLWIYSVLEQIFNDQFHLPNKDLFPYVVHWLVQLCIKMVRC